MLRNIPDNVWVSYFLSGTSNNWVKIGALKGLVMTIQSYHIGKNMELYCEFMIARERGFYLKIL